MLNDSISSYFKLFNFISRRKVVHDVVIGIQIILYLVLLMVHWR